MSEQLQYPPSLLQSEQPSPTRPFAGTELKTGGVIAKNHLALLNYVDEVVAACGIHHQMSEAERQMLRVFNVWRTFPNPQVVGALTSIDPRIVTSLVDHAIEDPHFEKLHETFEVMEEVSDRKQIARFATTFDEAIKDLDEVLRPKEFQYFSFSYNGYSNREIATAFSLRESSVATELTEIRKKIDKARLNPKGIKRAVEYEDPSVPNAVRNGTLAAKTFLGRNYTGDSLVARFLRRKRSIDPQWLKEGWVLLIHAVPLNEYMRYKEGHASGFDQFVKRHPGSGWVYTRAEYLPELEQHFFRKSNKQKTEESVLEEIFP